MCVLWYESGQKRHEYKYKDGKSIGLWVTWDKNGKRMSEEFFND